MVKLTGALRGWLAKNFVRGFQQFLLIMTFNLKAETPREKIRRHSLSSSAQIAKNHGSQALDSSKSISNSREAKIQ